MLKLTSEKVEENDTTCPTENGYKAYVTASLHKMASADMLKDSVSANETPKEK